MTPSTIYATRFAELGYRMDAPGCWRFVDRSTKASVGRHHPSRALLLADLNRYATEFGCAADCIPTPFKFARSASSPPHLQVSTVTTRRIWDAAEDQRLLELILRGYPRSVIATVLHRTDSSIRARGRRLAILPHEPLCDLDAGCTKCDDHRARLRNYELVLYLTAPELKDALHTVLKESRELCRDAQTPLHNALENGERLLNEIAARIKLPDLSLILNLRHMND